MYKKYNKSKPQFQILGDQEQILQVALFTGDTIYINGQLIYGSEKIFNKINTILNSLSRTFRLNFRSPQLQIIKNQNQYIEYFAVRKGHGKILCINVSLYNQMLVHPNKLLALNYEPIQEYFNINFRIPYLKKYTPKNPSEQDLIYIQGQSLTYIQKQLGQGQKIAMKEQCFLACSKTMKVNKIKNTLYFQGPGFVFMQLGLNQTNKKNPLLRNIFLFIFLIYVFEVIALSILDILA